MVAAFLIGLVAGLPLMRVIGEDGNLFFSTGIMGGLSTYSTLIMSTEKLLGDPDETVLAIVFLVLSMILGLILASFGMWLGQKIGKGRGKAFRRD